MFGPTAGATIVRISVLGEPDRRPGQESHFAARRHGVVVIAKPGFEPALGLANAVPAWLRCFGSCTSEHAK